MEKLRLMYDQQSAVARQHRMSAALADSVSYLPAASEATGISYVQDWTANLQDIQSRRLPEPPPLVNCTVGSQIIPGTELISEDKSDFQILPEKDYSDAGYVDMVLRPTFHDPPPQTSTPKRAQAATDNDTKLPPDDG